VFGRLGWSAGERDFLEAVERLAFVPGVEAFELLAEVSPKNSYRFGISMEFADRAAYEGYNGTRMSTEADPGRPNSDPGVVQQLAMSGSAAA
jgi:hypothetical protein